MDDPRKKRRIVAVGKHEPERTVDKEIFIDLLIFVGPRFARAGKHEYRRPFDALSVHFELCDMLRLGAINAARFACERGKIALLAVEELFDAEFFFQDGRNVACIVPFELGEKTARVVADVVFLETSAMFCAVMTSERDTPSFGTRKVMRNPCRVEVW